MASCSYKCTFVGRNCHLLNLKCLVCKKLPGLDVPYAIFPVEVTKRKKLIAVRSKCYRAYKGVSCAGDSSYKAP